MIGAENYYQQATHYFRSWRLLIPARSTAKTTRPWVLAAPARSPLPAAGSSFPNRHHRLGLASPHYSWVVLGHFFVPHTEYMNAATTFLNRTVLFFLVTDALQTCNTASPTPRQPGQSQPPPEAPGVPDEAQKPHSFALLNHPRALARHCGAARVRAVGPSFSAFPPSPRSGLECFRRQLALLQQIGRLAPDRRQ
jgi:hypothetical protein